MLLPASPFYLLSPSPTFEFDFWPRLLLQQPVGLAAAAAAETVPFSRPLPARVSGVSPRWRSRGWTRSCWASEACPCPTPSTWSSPNPDPGWRPSEGSCSRDKVFHAVCCFRCMELTKCLCMRLILGWFLTSSLANVWPRRALAKFADGTFFFILHEILKIYVRRGYLATFAD